MADEYPSSATAQVTLPSELATQVLEILSSSTVAALTAENIPGSRKVDVILPSEVAMQVYETLTHNSLTDMAPEEKPSSRTASIGVVEKVSVEVKMIHICVTVCITRSGRSSDDIYRVITILKI